ncbi:MAG: 30S ribosomal protein S12 methylthiotransferase RimO [Anaerolineaceae bacterium]
MKENTFYLISLGCAKNSVDADSMAALLINDGMIPVTKPSQARFLIVNTCGFIAPAREESITELQNLAVNKKSNQLLIATGCLPQRYGAQLLNEVSGMDGIIGTRNWMDIAPFIADFRNGNLPVQRFDIPDTPLRMDYGDLARVSIQGASAYLKIADGCRRLCAFCAIPLIKGKNVSRPIENIINDAQFLQENNIIEVNLIAQDTTDYGSDLGMKDGLSTLIDQICEKAPFIPWMRILYAYPGFVTDRLIDRMATKSQLLHYLDIPLQHADPTLLKKMKRPSNVDQTIQTIEKMRKAMPDLAIRTTFIVGYPGETEKEFQTLLDFLSEVKFDRVGVFPFSFEKGTASEQYGDPVSEEEKADRVERLMILQQDISLKLNQNWVGKTMQVLIEGADDTHSIGRSFRDAPEIDGLVFLDEKVEPGNLVKVQITGALVHDLTARLI